MFTLYLLYHILYYVLYIKLPTNRSKPRHMVYPTPLFSTSNMSVPADILCKYTSLIYIRCTL